MRVGDVYEDGDGRKVVILDINNRHEWLTVEKHYLHESVQVYECFYTKEQEIFDDGFFLAKETKVLRILKEYEKIRDRR